jgi:hypothetical protein
LRARSRRENESRKPTVGRNQGPWGSGLVEDVQ